MSSRLRKVLTTLVRGQLPAVAVWLGVTSCLAPGAQAATLSIVSQLDRIAPPHPWNQARQTGPAGAAAPISGSQLVRLVWSFQGSTRPTIQNIFGGTFETYRGGSVSILGLDGVHLFDLGSFTAVNFSEFDALALASDTADGVFIFRDPDFAHVARQSLGALAAPLRINGNTRVSEYFFRDDDDEVSRITASVGDLVPVGAAPVPAPALLLGSVLGILALVQRNRRSA